MRLSAACTTSLLALASCTAPGHHSVFSPLNFHRSAIASSYADAIAAGMERTQAERTREDMGAGRLR